MNSSRALASEQVVALTAGVARDLIDQGPGRGLPKPRFLMAVFAFYGLLGIVAGFGTQAARVAVAFGGVAALTTVVVGPGGIALAGLFDRLSGLTRPSAAAAAGFTFGPPGTQGPVGTPSTGSAVKPPPGPTGPSGPSAPRSRGVQPPAGPVGPVGPRSLGIDAASIGIFG